MSRIKSFRLRHKLISSLRDVDIRGVRKLAHHLPKILIPNPGGAITIRTLYGFPMIIDPVRDHGVEESIYYTGTYEKGTLFIINKILNEGDLFVDVGANIGLIYLFASLIVGNTGRVIAFEPGRETMAILKQNIELNNIQNIETSDCAVGSRRGHGKIYESSDMNRGGASLIKPSSQSVGQEVTITTLSAFLKDEPRVALIKVDIEGYELEALRGAHEILAGEPSPMLIIECSELRDNLNGVGTGALYDYLMSLGNYRLFKSRIDKSKVSRLVEIHHRSELPAHDNIYCFTGRHLETIPRKIFSK